MGDATQLVHPHTPTGPAFEITLLHGGHRPRPRPLDASSASNRHIFGPGLYLTEDPHVASAYVVRHQGAMYEVDLCGPAGGVLDLRLGIARCSAVPRYVLDLLHPPRWPGQTVYDQLANLHGPDSDATRLIRLNLQLAAFGVWLLVAHPGGSAGSGLMDHGSQFVLLNFDFVRKIRGPL